MKRFSIVLAAIALICMSTLAEARGRNGGGGKNSGMSGTVASIDAANSTFTLQSSKATTTIFVDNKTVFELDKQPATAGDVQVGSYVSITGAVVGQNRVRAMLVSISGKGADSTNKSKKNK